MTFAASLNKREKAGVAKALQGILDLYRKPSAWTKEFLARDSEGNPAWLGRWTTASPDESAVSYCLIGASRKVDGPYEAKALRVIAETIDPAGPIAKEFRRKRPCPMTVFMFNDAEHTTIADVRKVLRKALKAVTA